MNKGYPQVSNKNRNFISFGFTWWQRLSRVWRARKQKKPNLITVKVQPQSTIKTTYKVFRKKAPLSFDQETMSTLLTYAQR